MTPTRVLALAAAFLLVACNSDRTSLGRLENAKRMLFGCFPWMGADEAPSCEIYGIRDPAKTDEHFDSADCPCRGSATLHRAANGLDAVALDYQVLGCPHRAIVNLAKRDLDYWIPNADHARLERDLDVPGGNKQLPEHRLVTAMHVYGDRTIELNWSRDVHRAADGTLQVQDTESYFIVLRPRRGGDKETFKLDTEPVITGAPNCPPK